MIRVRSSLSGTLLACFSLLAVMPASAVSIDWATVGDAGNDGDTQLMKQDQTSGYGAVAYVYQIAKYDVTVAQYVEFLNAKDPTGTNVLGLYNGNQSTDGNSAGISFNVNNSAGAKYGVLPGQANKPITNVTWYSSLRFANWLNNGQGNGDTESGSYTLTGNSPTPSNSNAISRNAGANIVLPTENEWYKAAYYKGGGLHAGYWPYATRTSTLATAEPPNPNATNSANYNSKTTGYAVTGSSGYSSGVNYLTDVGAYGKTTSAYGTFDQTGDVFQWNQTTVAPDGSRGIRGGSWNLDDGALPSLNRDEIYHPDYANFFIGFRVANLAVAAPEPVGLSIWILGGMMLLRRNRRAS